MILETVVLNPVGLVQLAAEPYPLTPAELQFHACKYGIVTGDKIPIRCFPNRKVNDFVRRGNQRSHGVFQPQIRLITAVYFVPLVIEFIISPRMLQLRKAQYMKIPVLSADEVSSIRTAFHFS